MRKQYVAMAGAVLLAGVLGACGSVPTNGTILGRDVNTSQDPSPVVAHNSPSLVRNPVQATNIVVVDRVDRPDYTAKVHVSQDGGNTWRDTPLVLPADTPNSKFFAPSAVFDAKGILYVMFVTLSGPGNNPDSVWISRSSDGGLTFDQPSKVSGPHSFQTQLGIDLKTGRLFATWLQADLEAQTCILCFAKTGIPIVLSRSDDGGHTWSAPAQISDSGRQRVGAPALAVDSNGNPSVVYMDFGSDRVDWEGLPGTYDSRFSLVLARSTDRGERFAPGVVIDSDIVPIERFLVYLPVSPGLAISPSGEMVVAWADGRNGDADVLLRRSTDGGKTWSAVSRVGPGNAGNDGIQELPAVGIAPDGRIDVLYYDRSLDRRGTTADVMLSSSSDGGKKFKTLRLSTGSSNRLVGPMGSPFENEADFGTRITVLSSNRVTYTAWTDTRAGTVDNGKQDIYSASVKFPAAGGLKGWQVLLVLVAFALGVVGVMLMVASRRSVKRRTPPPPPLLVPSTTPPPAPPIARAPGQV